MRIEGTNYALFKLNKAIHRKKIEINQGITSKTQKLSSEEKAKQIKEDFEKKLKEIKAIERQLEECSKKSQQEKDAMEIHIKCLKIALRIMTGNIVPLKDHKFLAKNDPVLYGKSILMRIPKEKPIKYKAVTKNKDHTNNTSNNNKPDKSTLFPTKSEFKEESDEMTMVTMFHKLDIKA